MPRFLDTSAPGVQVCVAERCCGLWIFWEGFTILVCALMDFFGA